MIHYFWWIPGLFVICLYSAWLSVQVNKNPQSWLFWLMWVPVGLWPFISKLSKNLIFDGMLYDTLMCIFYATGFIIFGAGKDFTLINYIGMGVAVIGFFLIKL